MSYEVKITVTGNSWEDAQRLAREAADYLRENEPESCSLLEFSPQGSCSIGVEKKDKGE